MEKVTKHRSVRLKDKDLMLFDFIARFGFASVEQLHCYLGGSVNSLKTRLSHLVNDGYLVNHRIFFGKPSVYTITSKANRTELSLVKEVSLRDYEHDMLVIDVFLKLHDRFASHTTEKMLRAERGVGVGKSGRIPDLIGHTADGKMVAIEVDRTDKSLDRVRTIVVTYAGDSKYDEVWFICATQLIFNNLEKVNFADKIKLFHLKDIMASKELTYVRKDGAGTNVALKPGSEAEKILGKFFTPNKDAGFNLDEYMKATPKSEVAKENPEEEKQPGKGFGCFKFGK